MNRQRRVLTFANVCSFLALLVAISTGGAYASNTVFSTDIVDGEVKTADIANNGVTSDKINNGGVHADDLGSDSVGNAELVSGSVTNAKLGADSVDSSKVAGNTLTAFDLAGGESNGTISLPAGFVANGRCRNVTAAVGGAKVGDAVLFSINGPVPQGIMLSGVRVPTNGLVTMKVCNLSGGTMAAINSLPVAVVTITI